MYRVRIEKLVCASGDDGGDGFSAQLVYETDLPFPLVPGVSLGLYEWSEPSHDELRLSGRIMYTLPTRTFHAAAEASRHGTRGSALAAVRWLLEHGWRLDVGVAFDSPKDAHAVDPGEYHAVEIGGRFHSLTGDELLVLREQGTPHTVAMPAATV